MANFQNTDITGQLFGPRHSSPNPTMLNNSPRPPNVGPIPNLPPIGSAVPHMRLFNPMNVTPMPAGLMPPVALPWGAGVMPGIPMVPNVVSPYIPPQMQIPGTAGHVMQQINQSNMVLHSANQNTHHSSANQNTENRSANQNTDHRSANQNSDHRQESSLNANDKHDDRKHRHSHRRRHDEDRHHKRKGKHSGSRDADHKRSGHHRHKRDTFSPGRERHNRSPFSPERDRDNRSPFSHGRERDNRSPYSDRDRDRDNRACQERDNRGSERSVSGVILRDDRDEVDDNLGPRRSNGASDRASDRAILLEDGEIDSDGAYSIPDDRVSLTDRQNCPSATRRGSDRTGHSDSIYDPDSRNANYSDSRYGTDSRNDKYSDSRYGTDSRNDKYSDSRYGTDSRNDKYSDLRFDTDKRHTKHRARHNNDKKHSSNEQRHERRHHKSHTKTDNRNRQHVRHSREDMCNESNRPSNGRSDPLRGRSGAILLEDCNDGPILREDRNNGPILREDRDNGPILRKDRNNGPILREDRNNGPILRQDRNNGPILREDRNNGPILREDRKIGPILREDRNDGPILREDRNNGPILSEDCNNGPILREDRNNGPILREDRNDVPILREDRNDGPVLREDRKDGRRIRCKDRNNGPILRDDRNTGAILRKGRNDGPILRDDRSNGPILREDRSSILREDRNNGPILREDCNNRPILREDRNNGPILREDRYNGPIFREDRNSSPILCEDRNNGPILREDRNSGPILREDRNNGPILREDRNNCPILREDRNNGPILREDRNNGPILREDRYNGPILREDRSNSPLLLGNSVILNTGTGRTGAVLIEDRHDHDLDINDRGQRSRSAFDRNSQRRFESDLGRGRGPDDNKGPGRDVRERSVRNSLDRDRPLDKPQEANIGRTGALLLEDREIGLNQRDHSGSDNGKIGRSGALLLEDRNSGPPDVGQRGHSNSVRGQGHRGKVNLGRDRLERRSGSREYKRSRSPSIPNVRVKREPKSIEREEPETKKRKIWEPGPNDINTAKCIRTASQATIQDMGTLFSEPVASWVRCSAADLYFRKDPKSGNMVSTKRMQELEELFDNELVQRAAKVTALHEVYEKPQLKPNWKHRCKKSCGIHQHVEHSHSSSDSSDSESDSEEWWMDEFKFKQNNPHRLHKEIWYNDSNELNYGPLCRCSNKSKKFGIRHSIYPGEKPLPMCEMTSNNLDKLYHYRINVSPVKNFLINEPTVIMFDEHEYIFEGFSLFSHKPIPKFPDCQLIRFNIIYTIHVVEEQVPENFSVRSLDLFTEYLFEEILELIDIDWRGPGDGNQCRRYHIMPRFARPFPENGKELLSMNDVLLYLLKASRPLMTQHDLEDMYHLDKEQWTKFVDSFRHMVVTCPGKKPSSIRIDQLDKADCKTQTGYKFPVIIHHGVRPALLSYAGDPTYRKKWREYMKYRHLLWTRCKIGAKEKERLDEFEAELEKIRMKCTMKREVSAEIDSEGFLLTGIRADICQHAMLLPVLIEHLRFHECLTELEDQIKYKFVDRSLLQLALTHSSYKVNYGTNPDHGRNSLSNCGFRQVKFGDFKIHHQHTRKRGLNVLLKIMAKMGHKDECRSEIPHNERLEFLGDAVVEFITSTHLFNMFPQASEGELTLYRGSLVQNAHLAVLADKLRLQDFLLFAHGPDLCHDSNLKHAMANCFEAFLGALFIDGGIVLADKVFSENLFHEKDLLDTWVNTPPHPLISDELNGDRHWIEQSPILQKLTSFEDDIGYEFKYIRLLAKAFTQRNVGYNNLTFGHNQRLEFLGDTVMQLICSEYLFRHFPDHHEGHLTLLRSSLVNNKTQSTVAAELGMPDFVIKANMTKVDEKTQASADLKTKEKADLLEALLGSLLVDGGLEPCKVLIEVCFLPRLQDFILDQEWNDPKSELQQCCLTLRDINDETPDIPVYKVLKASGPTNQRTYTVAVYFREKRLAVGTGGAIQLAEMKAAETALTDPAGLFHNKFFNSKNKRLQSVIKTEPWFKKEDT